MGKGEGATQLDLAAPFPILSQVVIHRPELQLQDSQQGELPPGGEILIKTFRESIALLAFAQLLLKEQTFCREMLLKV
jgi:hypothetical protein